MGRCLLLAVVVAASGCKAELDDPNALASDGGTTGGDGPRADSAIDAFVLGPWGTPAKVTGASTIAIEDDGTLSPNQLELIFDRFYRAQKGDRVRAGTGLGLAICRKLVRRMYGRIWVSDRDDGANGTSVRFALPKGEAGAPQLP